MTLVFVLPLRPRPLRGVGTCPLIHSNYFSLLVIRFCHWINPNPNPNPNSNPNPNLTLTLSRPKNKSGEITESTGCFYGPQSGGVLALCLYQIWSRFSIRSKVIKGFQNFEIRSRDLGHAHLGVVLWSGRSRGPSSMSVPNLKRMALSKMRPAGRRRHRRPAANSF